MVMSLYTEKTFGQIQHPFMIKILKRAEIKETYLNIIYSKPRVNIKLVGENPKTIPRKSEMSQVCPLFSYLFSIVLEVLARAIR